MLAPDQRVGNFMFSIKNAVAFLGYSRFFFLFCFTPEGDLRVTFFKGSRDQAERYAQIWKIEVFKASIHHLPASKLDDLEAEMLHHASTLDKFMKYEGHNMPWDAFTGEDLEKSIEAKNVLRMIEIERQARANAEHRAFAYKGEMGII